MRLGEFEEEVDCLECHPGYGTAHYSDAIVEEVDKTYTCALCHNEKADQYHNLTYTYGEGGPRLMNPVIPAMPATRTSQSRRP
jgi:hypothetical protein